MERGKAAGLTTHAPERMTARPLDLFSVSCFKRRNKATFTPSAAVGLPGRKPADIRRSTTGRHRAGGKAAGTRQSGRADKYQSKHTAGAQARYMFALRRITPPVKKFYSVFKEPRASAF